MFSSTLKNFENLICLQNNCEKVLEAGIDGGECKNDGGKRLKANGFMVKFTKQSTF